MTAGAPHPSAAVAARASDGTRLAWSSTGGGPALLLIPGLGATRAAYDPVVPGLARRHRVIAFDPRGVGGSDVAAGPYTMAQLAGDAIAVLDAAGEERAAVLGASMGGMVAQHVAIDRPDRVSALILAATGPGGGHAVPAEPRATDALYGRGARTPGDAYRVASTVLYSPAFRRAHPDFVDAQVRFRARHPVRARVFTAQSAAVAGHDTYNLLPLITAPTLVLHGELDAVSPVANAAVLAERIPGARLTVLPGAGHLFFHEMPEETVRLVEEFLAECAAMVGRA